VERGVRGERDAAVEDDDIEGVEQARRLAREQVAERVAGEPEQRDAEQALPAHPEAVAADGDEPAGGGEQRDDEHAEGPETRATAATMATSTLAATRRCVGASANPAAAGRATTSECVTARWTTVEAPQNELTAADGVVGSAATRPTTAYAMSTSGTAAKRPAKTPRTSARSGTPEAEREEGDHAERERGVADEHYVRPTARPLISTRVRRRPRNGAHSAFFVHFFSTSALARTTVSSPTSKRVFRSSMVFTVPVTSPATTVSPGLKSGSRRR